MQLAALGYLYPHRRGVDIVRGMLCINTSKHPNNFGWWSDLLSQMAAMNQYTLSTYNSIIPEEGVQWAQLPDSDQLARLHGKFWGVSMQDEETKWRKTQPNEEPLNVDVDNQKPEEHEKVEDDIGPGSYILTLGIPGIEVSQLWVRQEYIRAYDYCEKYLDACIKATLTPSVVLTGQPGIGASRTS